MELLDIDALIDLLQTVQDNPNEEQASEARLALKQQAIGYLRRPEPMPRLLAYVLALALEENDEAFLMIQDPAFKKNSNNRVSLRIAIDYASISGMDIADRRKKFGDGDALEITAKRHHVSTDVVKRAHKHYKDLVPEYIQHTDKITPRLVRTTRRYQTPPMPAPADPQSSMRTPQGRHIRVNSDGSYSVTAEQLLLCPDEIRASVERTMELVNHQSGWEWPPSTKNRHDEKNKDHRD